MSFPNSAPSFHRTVLLLGTGLLVLNVVTFLHILSSSQGGLLRALERVAPGLVASGLFVLILIRLGRRLAELNLKITDEGILWRDRRGARELRWDDLERVRLRGNRICLEGRGSRLSLPLFKLIPAVDLVGPGDPRDILQTFLETLRARAPHAQWTPSPEDWIPES
jgi:hypothetical protein